MQQLGSSFSQGGARSAEDAVHADIEGLLSGASAVRRDEDVNDVETRRAWGRLLMPLMLLAGFGVIFALVPIGGKPTISTGRSVAHTP